VREVGYCGWKWVWGKSWVWVWDLSSRMSEEESGGGLVLVLGLWLGLKLWVGLELGLELFLE
jgi:hypothetical protein